MSEGPRKYHTSMWIGYVADLCLPENGVGRREREGYSPSVRASTQPDTTVGTVRFGTQYLKDFSRSKYLLCPFQGNKGALLWRQ